MLEGAEHGKYPDGNTLLVAGTEATVVVDPSLTVHRRGGVGRPVDRVLISHAHEDHLAGLGAVAGRQVSAHHDDLLGVRSLDGIMAVYGIDDPADAAAWRAELVERFHLHGWPGASGFADGEVWDLGGVTVSALHLPGHTRGHTAFLVEPDGVAYVGDIDLTGFGPYYGDHWSDLDDFVASIERAAEIEARWFATFHHKGVIDGRSAFVEQLHRFAAVIDRRDDRLLDLLAGGATTLDALVEHGIVYRPGTRPALFGTSVERRTITMHLDRLIRGGAVQRDDDGRLARR